MRDAILEWTIVTSIVVLLGSVVYVWRANSVDYYRVELVKAVK